MSVDSAETELTAQLDLTGVASGTYDVTLGTPAYQTVTLPGAYTVTADPAVTASGFRDGTPAPAVPALSYAAHPTVAGLIVVPVSVGLADHYAS